MSICHHNMHYVVGPVEYNVQIGLTWYHKSIVLKPKAGESSRVDDPASRKPNKLWRDEDVDMLVNARCQTNPPTFKHIASQINLMNASLGMTIDRPFDEVDCTNKWNKMFPTSEDANKTHHMYKIPQVIPPGNLFLPERVTWGFTFENEVPGKYHRCSHQVNFPR